MEVYNGKESESMEKNWKTKSKVKNLPRKEFTVTFLHNKFFTFDYFV